MKKIYVLIILFLFLTEIFANDTTYFILSSGGNGFPYHQTAIELAELINPKLNSSKIVPIISNGSIDNLNSLESGFADFIICQRDALSDNYFSNEKPLKNLVVVLPLFTEGLQLFVKGDGNTISFKEFIDRIRNEAGIFAIGKANSTSNVTTRNVFKLLGVTQDNFFNETITLDNYCNFFNDEKIVAFSILSAFPINDIAYDLKGFDIVSFNEYELNILQSHFIDLDEMEFNAGVYPQMKPENKIKTIGTWALLVSLSKTIERFSAKEDISIPKVIIKNLSKINNEHSTLKLSYNNSSPFQISYKNNRIYLKHKTINIPLFFRGLPLSKDLSRILRLNKYLNISNFILLGFILLVIFFLFRFLRKDEFGLLWHKYKHFIYAAIFFLIAYILIANIIYKAENDFFIQYAIKSPVLNLTFIEFNKWLILAVLTDYYYADVFPISTIGQIGVSITFYLIWIAGFFLILYEIVNRLRQQKRRKGMKNVNLSNHFVICGWNSTSNDFVTTIKNILNNYIVHNSNKIVIVNKYLRDNFEQHEDLIHLQDKKQLEYIYGDAKDNRSLKAASINKAKTVILLADDNSMEADERTLLRALAISRYCKEEAHDTIDHIYIIAEINNPELKESFYDSDVNEIVCTAETGKNILIQSMINHGISEVLSTILTYNRNNEFYSIDLRRYKMFVGKKFDKLLLELRKHNILLIGIKSRHFDENGKEIIDIKKLKILNKKKFGIDRCILVNPHTKEENNYIADDDDELIVLAVNEKAISKLQ